MFWRRIIIFQYNYGSIYLSRQLDQLAIYKHDRGVEPGSIEKQLQFTGQNADTKLAATGFQV